MHVRSMCMVHSTSIGLSSTSQIMENYGMLWWIMVTVDYGGLRRNLEITE
jgi:hypothetical protein